MHCVETPGLSVRRDARSAYNNYMFNRACRATRGLATCGASAMAGAVLGGAAAAAALLGVNDKTQAGTPASQMNQCQTMDLQAFKLCRNTQVKKGSGNPFVNQCFKQWNRAGRARGSRQAEIRISQHHAVQCRSQRCRGRWWRNFEVRAGGLATQR